MSCIKQGIAFMVFDYSFPLSIPCSNVSSMCFAKYGKASSLWSMTTTVFPFAIIPIRNETTLCISVRLSPLNGSSMPRTSDLEFRSFRSFIRMFSPPDKVEVGWPISRCPNKIDEASCKAVVILGLISLKNSAASSTVILHISNMDCPLILCLAKSLLKPVPAQSAHSRRSTEVFSLPYSI